MSPPVEPFRPRLAPVRGRPARAGGTRSDRRAGLQALIGTRRRPSAGWLARRHRAVRLAKFVLPGVALALLGALVIWPRLGQLGEHGVIPPAPPGVSGDIVYGARYRGLDEQNRPYTLRADIARRIDAQHVALTRPTGELRVSPDASAMLRAAHGVYRDAAHALDLSGDVTLYRSDGTVLITDSAAIDLRRGAAAGSAPVHATGPFGALRAEGGFTLLDKGGNIQFAGPARLVLDGAVK